MKASIWAKQSASFYFLRVGASGIFVILLFCEVFSKAVQSQNIMKFTIGVTGMTFGRTEVLIGAKYAPSRELSYGHGLISA